MTADTRKWWALGALVLSVLVIGLDATVLNVALPTLATELDASTGQLQWFADAYNLVFAAMLLPGGLLGDRFGRRKTLLVALALFGVGSVACAAAGSAAQLIAARALLGLGGGMIIPLSMAALTVLFTDEERPRALAMWVAANAVAWPIGPILGGWLLDSFWWGSVFLINVPIVAAALVAVWRLMPESRSGATPRVDAGGIAMSSTGLAAITYGAIEAGERGWGDVRTLVALAAGTLVLASFVAWQLRIMRRPGGEPLVDLTLFRSRHFTWGTVLTTLVSFAIFGLLFALPQFSQAVAGADALHTGLRLLPIIGGLLVGAQIADRIVGHTGPRVVVAIGFAVLAAGLAIGASTDMSSSYGFQALWIALTGLGMGFAMPTAMDAGLGALSPDRSGVGSGLLMSVRSVGATIGVAVLGTVLNSGYRGELDVSGLPAGAAASARDSAAAGVATAQQLGSAPLLHSVRSAFVDGLDTMLLVSSAVAVAGLVLTMLFLPRRRAVVATEQEEPAEFEQHELAA
jgi:DHA2 family multidrug resistance protein-like MFS transporter